MLIVLTGLVYWDSEPKFTTDNGWRHSAVFETTFESILDGESVTERDHAFVLIIIEQGGLSVREAITIIDAIEDDTLKLLSLREALRSQGSDHNAYELGISYGLDANQVDRLKTDFEKI